MLQLVPDTATRNEYSEQTARIIDDEVRRIIDEQRERVADILSRRHKVLLRAGQLLMAKETITGEELREMLAMHENDIEHRATGRCCAAGPVRARRRAPPRGARTQRRQRRTCAAVEAFGATTVVHATPITKASPHRTSSDRIVVLRERCQTTLQRRMPPRARAPIQSSRALVDATVKPCFRTVTSSSSAVTACALPNRGPSPEIHPFRLASSGSGLT